MSRAPAAVASLVWGSLRRCAGSAFGGGVFGRVGLGVVGRGVVARLGVLALDFLEVGVVVLRGLAEGGVGLEFLHGVEVGDEGAVVEVEFLAGGLEFAGDDFALLLVAPAHEVLYLIGDGGEPAVEVGEAHGFEGRGHLACAEGLFDVVDFGVLGHKCLACAESVAGEDLGHTAAVGGEVFVGQFLAPQLGNVLDDQGIEVALGVEVADFGGEHALLRTFVGLVEGGEEVVVLGTHLDETLLCELRHCDAFLKCLRRTEEIGHGQAAEHLFGELNSVHRFNVGL